jgi:hypothetical protein
VADFSKVKKFGRVKNNRSLDVESLPTRMRFSGYGRAFLCRGFHCCAMIAGASVGEAGSVCAAPVQAPIQRRLLDAKDFKIWADGSLGDSPARLGSDPGF